MKICKSHGTAIGSLLALSILLAGCSTVARRSDVTFDGALKAILGLRDDGYFGGLTEDDVALAQRLADAAGFPKAEACVAPTPLQGVLVGNVAAPGTISPETPQSLRRILESIDSNASRHARDVLAYALGDLGTSIKDHARLVTNRWPRSPWLRDASSRILCERVAAAPADEVLPAGHEMQRCTAVRELVVRMAEAVSHWPRSLLAGPTQDTCGYSPEVAADLLRIIDNQHQLDETRSDALSLVSAWAQGKGIDRSVLRQKYEVSAFGLSRTSTGELQRWAEQLLVDMRTSAGAQTLAQRVYAGGMLWFEKEVCDFKEQADTLVPALIHALSDPVWHTRVDAAEALKCFADPRSVPALVSALDAPDYEVQEAALVTLSYIRPWNSEVAQAVKQLGTTHWSARIRRLAHTASTGKALDELTLANGKKQTLETICVGDCTKDQEQARCSTGEFEDGKYRVAGEGVVLVEWKQMEKQPFDADKLGDLAEHAKYCEKTTSDIGADATLVGLTCFEWTGGAYIVEKGKPSRQIYDQGVEHFFRIGNRTFFVGAAFLFAGESGIIGEVVTDREKGLKVEPVVGWPGIPTYFAFSPAGKVLLSDGSSALTLDADGKLASMQCLE